MSEHLIKSRQRVKDHAEVFTPLAVVNEMLDMVASAFPSDKHPERIDARFLEPACGNGNFLVEILRRKLVYIDGERFAAMPDPEARRLAWEHLTLVAVASIYGVDIQEDNVREARENMAAVIVEQFHERAPMPRCTNAFGPAVTAILTGNIICADALHDTIDFTFYDSDFDDECRNTPGFFWRTVVRHDIIRRDGKPLTGREKDGELALAQSVTKKDWTPVHYSGLESPVLSLDDLA